MADLVNTSSANAASTKQQILKQTQTKAQELLQTLDAARRQKISNEKMKNLCLDNEETMMKLHQQTFSQKQQRELNKALQKSQELLVDFEKDINYSQLRKFNVERYMEDCKQEMSLKEMVKPEDEASTVHLEQLSDELARLKGQGRQGESYGGCVEFSVRQCAKILAVLKESKLHSQAWSKVIVPFTVLLKDVINSPPFVDCLIEANEDCKRMAFNVEECSEAQAKAIADGEMETAESFYYTKIQMQESLSDLIKKKFGILEQEEVTAFQIPLKRVQEAHQQAAIDIAGLLKGFQKTKERAMADLSRLMNEVEKVNGEDYVTTKCFIDAQQESNKRLADNTKSQQECWKKIDELEKTLIQLGQERFAEVKRRIKSVDREAKRNVEFQHFQQFVRQQQQLLELTIRNCELAEESTDLVEELLNTGCNSIEHNLREIKHGIELEKLKIHEEYYTSFRTMYLTIGDLQYKKERFMEQLEEKIQTAHIQQEFYMDTLNPKAKEFAQQKKTLAGAKSEMEKQMESLRVKQVQYIEWFQPTEKALIEAGRSFKHPQSELREINESRANKLLEYHDLMAQQEEDATEYAHELAEVERLRQQAQTMRITAGSSVTSPSSTKLSSSINRS